MQKANIKSTGGNGGTTAEARSGSSVQGRVGG